MWMLKTRMACKNNAHTCAVILLYILLYIAELKSIEDQNEPEYGRILSTDNNAYVLTPSLQLNGEAMFLNWQRDDLYNNWPKDGKHSLDVATEETHFLPKNAKRKPSQVGKEGFEKKLPEVECLVQENQLWEDDM